MRESDLRQIHQGLVASAGPGLAADGVAGAAGVSLADAGGVYCTSLLSPSGEFSPLSVISAFSLKFTNLAFITTRELRELIIRALPYPPKISWNAWI